jgi:hypothetical protein
MKLTNIIQIVLGVFFLTSCKNAFDGPTWDSKIVAPLVKTSLSIDNIVRDTTHIQINPDQTITLVNRDSIAGISLDTLVALNTPAFEQTRKLDQIVLDERSDTTVLNMGQILRSANLQAIANLHGSYYPFPVSLGPVPVNNVNIDISQFFTTANIKTGNLELKVINELPLNLTNVDLTVRNAGNSNIIIQKNVPSIPSNTTYITNEDLAGKLVEGSLLGNMILSANTSSGFTIDTNRAVTLIMTISGVTVNSATAIFPAQEVVNNTDVVILQGMDDIRLTKAIVKSGNIVAEAISTINDSLFFDYLIPGAVKNGIPFSTSEAVPPNGNNSYSYDFSGYELDLTGVLNDTVNTFVNQLVGNMKYTGNLISMSLNDSLRIRIGTENLTPSYVKGFLGRDTIQIGPDVIELDLFKNVIGGSISFEEADIRMAIENGMGLPGGVVINQVRAENTRTGASVLLTGPNMGNLLMIPPAIESPYTPGYYEINLSTAAGHNAEDLLSLLPDKITYDVMVITNPAGYSGVSDLNQFAFTDKSITANLDVSIPLSIISNNLTLMDTVATNPAAIKKRNVKSGSLNVVANNGFPLDASLEMYLMDQYYTITDSLTSSTKVNAAPVDGSNKVSAKQQSVVAFEADEATMQNLYNASYIAFKVHFTTEPVTPHLKIYSNYSIDFKIVGDLNYSF